MSFNLYAIVAVAPDLLNEEEHNLLMGLRPKFTEHDERNVYEMDFSNKDWAEPLQELFESFDGTDEGAAIVYSDESDYMLRVYGNIFENRLSINFQYG